MRCYSFLKPLPGGRYEMIGTLRCVDDAQATDDLSATFYPEAEVWEGSRYVATLPPLEPAGEPLEEQTVRFEPCRTGSDPAAAGAEVGMTLRRRPTWSRS